MAAVARFTFPRPEELEPAGPALDASGLPRVFWLYVVAAGLVGAGFADFPLIAFHFQRHGTVAGSWIPAFFAVAMGVSGVGSLVFGRMFDRRGLRVLVPLTLAGALFAPLVFLGSFPVALVGAALWGLGMGVHESIIPAAVAPMVPVERRASAYGLFTAAYGAFWFVGSAAIGVLYDRSLAATIVFCVVLQVSAVPLLVRVGRAVT